MDSSVITTSSAAQSHSSFSQNSIAVGSTWMLSSMLFTTYYSTAFLKHGKEKEQQEKDDFESRRSKAFMRRTKPVTLESQTPKKPLKSNFWLTEYYSRPQLLTLYRLSGSFLLGIFANPSLFKWRERLTQSLDVMKYFALPAMFMFLANYFNVVALDRLGISLTYTSKCGIPILTVLITILVEGIDAIPSILTLCTLIPIGIGIALASWNSPTFDLSGFLAAILSATSQASLNVFCKSALTRTKISGLQAQTTMAAVAFCIAIVTITLDSVKKHVVLVQSKEDDENNKSKTAKKKAIIDKVIIENPPLLLSIGAVSSYHIEYVLSFLFLSLVKPITYGTCDAIRRLGIIISGRQMFGGEAFSYINYSGIALALLGALLYSISSSKT